MVVVSRADGGTYVGNISKYGKERLRHRNVELKVDCPNCGTARITLAYNGNGDIWDDVTCPKCHSRIIMDNLSLTVMVERSFEKKGGLAVDRSIII